MTTGKRRERKLPVQQLSILGKSDTIWREWEGNGLSWYRGERPQEEAQVPTAEMRTRTSRQFLRELAQFPKTTPANPQANTPTLQQYAVSPNP